MREDQSIIGRIANQLATMPANKDHRRLAVKELLEREVHSGAFRMCDLLHEPEPVRTYCAEVLTDKQDGRLAHFGLVDSLTVRFRVLRDLAHKVGYKDAMRYGRPAQVEDIRHLRAGTTVDLPLTIAWRLASEYARGYCVTAREAVLELGYSWQGEYHATHDEPAPSPVAEPRRRTTAQAAQE